MVQVSCDDGQPVLVRALLDPCAELTLTSISLARKLRASLHKTAITISGVAGGPMDHARTRTHFHIHAADDSPPVSVGVYCLQKFNLATPAGFTNEQAMHDWEGLELADPRFGHPRAVDLLLGADVYPLFLRPELLRRNEMMAQRTAFGWIITGRAPSKDVIPTTNTCTTLITCPETTWHDKLISLMQRFWELEDLPRASRPSPLDEECEVIFACHQRTSEGRYIVRLPLKQEGLEMLGESLNGALASLSTLHRRLSKDVEMAKAYTCFMTEYVRLGHMRPIPSPDLRANARPTYYIPHHGIWQRGDHHRRLRVVFNASRPTSTGQSLNDTLHTGPKLQTNLGHVLIRWRRHRIAFGADVCMMYRQILVNEQDVDLQRIVWSARENDPVVHYQLLTVTYGESCSPYLALRTLQQLCTDHGSAWPDAARVLLKDRFVDDILTGCNDLREAKKLRDQLIHLLQLGGFPLRKWVANRPELLEDLTEQDRLRPTWLQLCSDGLINELGVCWDPQNDCFRLTPPEIDSHNLTKRNILATTARLFDPCGWIAPVTLIAKQLVQDLWRAGLEWDEPIPLSFTNRWTEFTTNLKAIGEISIPRWIDTQPTAELQLHVFSDASRRAMAATVYSRVNSISSQTCTRLLAAKTKLSPIRSLRPPATQVPRMTIPRLELRASLLAAQLLRSLASDLEIPMANCVAWTDSQIVLHWLRSSEPTGNALIDNYVEHIQELLPASIWRYVPTESNPADLATRGVEPPQLLSCKLWWSGPDWLASSDDLWPSINNSAPVQSFVNSPTTKVCCALKSFDTDLLDRYSDLGRLLRVVVYMLRWIKHRRQPADHEPKGKFITANELTAAFHVCVRLSQSLWLPEEFKRLRNPTSLPARLPFQGLGTFIDTEGIIRIGGRLQNSGLSYAERHPPVIDGRCSLAGLIISWAHQRSLHGSFRTTYAYMLHRAWILGGKRKLRSALAKCVICIRSRARPSNQVMAPLPAARVTPSRPFSKTGLDYAGPFQILSAKGRGIRSTKGYIVVLVCFATKMLHLELVGDMTTDSLMGALARFFSRRGKPSEMWSDNGTYFHRADFELREAFETSQLSWTEVSGSLATQEVTWHFIPPGAPHFGGLWEAGVKLVKTHLKRVLGTRRLTYEEFSTLLASIEMVLNSRPLTALTGDPDDLDALTPGHFAIGGPLISIPDVEMQGQNPDQLTHWKLARALRNQFWNRWSLEYLNTLQQRTKWTRSRSNLKVGDMVVVVDPSLLSVNGRWPLARILKTHPGKDGVVRVATIRTSNGEYVRPITKLASLPLDTLLERPLEAVPVESDPVNSTSTAGG